jgi:hypothetical protein
LFAFRFAGAFFTTKTQEGCSRKILAGSVFSAVVDNQILSQSQKPIDEILTNAAIAGLPIATMGLKSAWRTQNKGDSEPDSCPKNALCL